MLYKDNNISVGSSLCCYVNGARRRKPTASAISARGKYSLKEKGRKEGRKETGGKKEERKDRERNIERKKGRKKKEREKEKKRNVIVCYYLFKLGKCYKRKVTNKQAPKTGKIKVAHYSRHPDP